MLEPEQHARIYAHEQDGMRTFEGVARLIRKVKDHGPIHDIWEVQFANGGPIVQRLVGVLDIVDLAG